MVPAIPVTTCEITPTQFEEAMAHYAEARERTQAINKAIEVEINDILSTYTDELMCLNQTSDKAYHIIKSYCMFHKHELFQKRRSIGTPFGIVGFRLGTPRLKSKKGTNWNDVVMQLKEKLPDYVRTVQVPAKNELLANRHSADVAPFLNEVGVQVVQDDLFFIDTKQAA